MSKSPQKWYSIRARAATAAAAAAVAAGGVAASSAEIFIYGDIGESWWGESVAAADFVKEVAALNVDELTVRINSFGGSVSDGIAIYNALKRHRAAVTVSIDGTAMSIASLIAMAGDTVEMAENAILMIHAPWVYASGNAVALREVADYLDTWSQAMSNSYAAKTGRPAEEMLALLTDGVDHYYTAEQALAEKFVDTVTTAMPIAASHDLSRFRAIPAAAAAFNLKEKHMPHPNPAAAAPAPATPADSAAQASQAEAVARGVQAEAQRRTDIRAAFASFGAREGVADLMAACEADTQCSVQGAREKLLAHLGKEGTPVAGNIVTVEDEQDKFRAAATEAILARAAARDDKGSPVRANAANPLRGYKLLDLARACLVRAGVKVDGMDQMKIVAAAFTQSTSDFPILLENTMHKTLQQAYALAPDTWSRFCSIGSVSDFRAHPRYRVGSLGNLDVLNELGEFKNKTIPDGEKASITAGTRGNIINLSRQMIINDDLGAFIGLASMLGRAAKRTIEAAVYARLAENSGAGPTLEDGLALFHASHGNIAGTAAAPAVASFEAGRVQMAQQKDVSGNDYLDLRPAIWLGPIGIGGTARVTNDAQYDPDTANKLQKPNLVRGLVRDIVDTPRLSGTAWYFFADPAEAPALEVAFLDGAQDPYLELQNGFDVDGARYKVRIDFGVAGIDYRGAHKNPGA
ncbi:ClpP-like prohead protease/major capsid protein fusion protein [Cupriavidus necator]|uniref:ClpP-like prohead protease/major capsid protein fusion protein n=1 Tax=Cupriavidus necator TaxID=106590 RepID=UPI0005B41CF1|nr:ClpP-like prohead protease/major capsid protein fusion protein [Cupriavidus necator]